MTPHGADISTPALLVDLDVLERNIADMAALATDRGVALRPHAKTHKSPVVARLQMDAGAQGLTVATVSEAEVFAAAGFTDLFIGYPLWVDKAKGRRLRALVEKASLTIGVDSPEAAHALAAQLGDDAASVSLLVEVDSGHHRSGVAPERVRHARRRRRPHRPGRGRGLHVPWPQLLPRRPDRGRAPGSRVTRTGSGLAAHRRHRAAGRQRRLDTRPSRTSPRAR